MRRNSFGEAYCHSVSEIAEELEAKDHNHQTVYASTVDVDSNEKPCLEVLENISGDTVFYIEADDEDGCRRLAEAVEIDIL